MRILLGLTLNFFLGSLLFIAVLGLGRFILLPLQKKKENSNLALKLASSFATGLAFYTVSIHQLATHKLPFRWFITLSCVLGITSFTYDILKTKKEIVKKIISLVFLGSILAIWANLPGLVSLFNSGVTLGMVTRGNNDIAYYAAVASEFFKSGFINSNHISSIDLNFVAATSHYFSPTALFTMSNGLTSLESWQTAMIVIIASFSFAWVALVGMSKSVFTLDREKKNTAYLVSAIAMLSGLVIYIYGNYFLAQILSIGISALIFTNCVEFFIKRDFSWFQILQSTVSTILALFTYPHILIPLYFVCAVLMLSIGLIKHKSIKVFQLSKFICGILIGIVISKDYLHFSFFLFRSMTGTGAAGWRLPALNPTQIIFWPQLIGWPTPKVLNFLLWSIAFAVMALVIHRIHGERVIKYIILFFSFGGSVAIVLYVLIKKQNFDTYTSWKLISYLLPMILILFFSYIGNYSKRGLVYLWILFGITAMSPALMWSQAQIKPLTLGVSVNSDMVNLASSKQIKALSAINIDVDPMFETMALSTMIKGPRVFPNALSYFPIGEDTEACTIVHSNSLRFPFMKRLNNTYWLGSTVSEGCSAEKPSLEIGKEYQTNSAKDIALTDGWSSPEAWGTWSVGGESHFSFRAIFQKNASYALVLKTAGYVTTKNPMMEMLVRVNNSPPQKILFTLVNQQQRNVIRLIPPLNFSNYKKLTNVSFEIKSPKSPQELGLSGDTRKLGFGLISVKIVKN